MKKALILLAIIGAGFRLTSQPAFAACVTYGACASGFTNICDLGCVRNANVSAAVAKDVVVGGRGVQVTTSDGASSIVSKSSTTAPLVSTPVSGPTTASSVKVLTSTPVISATTCDGTSTNGCVGQAPGYVFSIGTDCLTCNGSPGGHCGRTVNLSCPTGGYASVPAIAPTGGLDASKLAVATGDLAKGDGSGVCHGG